MKEKMMQERLSIDTNNPIRARFFDYSRFTYPWHFHGEYEIIYIKHGAGTRYVADSIESFQNGDIILLGQNVPHFLKNDADIESTGARVTGVIIQFEKDFMGHAMDNYPGMLHIKALLSDAKRGIHIPSSFSAAIVPYIEAMPNLMGIDQLIGLLTLLEKMAHLSQKRALGSEYFYNHLSLFTDSRIEKVISYVNFHYKESIRLSQIATLASMNASAFCRYFKKKSGKSFTRYIIELRVGYACKLLVADELNIFQISLESGFNSISHFNSIFKQITGYSPSGYRRQMGR